MYTIPVCTFPYSHSFCPIRGLLNYHLPTTGLRHGLHSSPLCAWTGFPCQVRRHEIVSIYALIRGGPVVVIQSAVGLRSEPFSELRFGRRGRARVARLRAACGRNRSACRGHDHPGGSRAEARQSLPKYRARVWSPRWSCAMQLLSAWTPVENSPGPWVEIFFRPA